MPSLSKVILAPLAATKLKSVTRGTCREEVTQVASRLTPIKRCWLWSGSQFGKSHKKARSVLALAWKMARIWSTNQSARP